MPMGQSQALCQHSFIKITIRREPFYLSVFFLTLYVHTYAQAQALNRETPQSERNPGDVRGLENTGSV